MTIVMMIIMHTHSAELFQSSLCNRQISVERAIVQCVSLSLTKWYQMRVTKDPDERQTFTLTIVVAQSCSSLDT
jgi:hypothetical protein